MNERDWRCGPGLSFERRCLHATPPVKRSACSEPAKRFAVCTHRSLSLSSSSLWPSSSATSTSSSAVSSRNLEQFVCARVKSAGGEVTWVLLSTELIETASTQELRVTGVTH